MDVDPPQTPARAAAARTRTPFPPAPGSRFAPGAMLAGRYHIIALLGQGGMGEVYRAHDLTLDQPVALKFLPESMAQSPAMLARFHSEVRIARLLLRHGCRPFSAATRQIAGTSSRRSIYSCCCSLRR
jgi:serine/threonine-protein kinase